MGTADYMSPEQALGEPTDHRSDIYSLGIVLYELFTGVLPFQGETMISRLSERVHKKAPSPKRDHPDLPDYLVRIISQCLERDPGARYQSVDQVLADLQREQVSSHHRIASVFRSKALRIAAAAGVAAAIGLVAYWGLSGRGGNVAREGASATAPSVSLAILPFRNASGDAELNWLGQSLSETLRTEVGQSQEWRTISSDRLFQILRDLRLPADAEFDENTLRRLAEFSSATTLVWGQYARFGDRIRIDATLRDLKSQRTFPLKVEAAGENDILRTIDVLAQEIRQNLTTSRVVVQQLEQNAFKPSTESVPALRSFTDGLQLGRAGKHIDALKSFESATQADPKFALAWARMAQTHSTLGQGEEARQASRRAVLLSVGLPSQERFLIAANDARISSDNSRAIESYENLAKVLPDDTDVRFALGGLYETTGSFDKALNEFRSVLARDPKHIDALFAVGRVEIQRKNPQGALEPLSAAVALTVQIENDEARGRILNAIGIAYKRLNKPQDAMRYYEEALVIRRKLGQKAGIASTLNEMAQIQDMLANSHAALTNYREALALNRELGNNLGTANALLNLGSHFSDRALYDDALVHLKEALQMYRQLGNTNFEALSMSNIGNVYLSQGSSDEALTYLTQSLQLREKLGIPADLAQTHHNLGETYVQLGQLDQALDHYLKAVEFRRTSGDRRGAAIETYSMGAVFELQGRYEAARSSKEEAFHTFRELEDRTYWHAQVQAGYGAVLSQIGKWDEAQTHLDEGLKLGRESNNRSVLAQILVWQGEDALLRPDVAAARPKCEEALRVATEAGDQAFLLLAQGCLSRIEIAESRYREAVRRLRDVSQRAEKAGLRHLAVEAGVSLGEAYLGLKNHTASRKELEGALDRARKMGLRPLEAKGHFLLGRLYRATGNEGLATAQIAEARRIIETLVTESKEPRVRQRRDFASIMATPSN